MIKKGFYSWNPLIALLAIGAFLFTRQLFEPSLGYPDADRILMDGVFIHDFLRDLPVAHPYDYVIHYYGQYPALSIGYRPPFFPFVEGLFNLVFGVNMWSSRLALLFFGLAGITAWFALIRRMFDDWTAFFSTLLLITLPFVAKWGWYTMGELPLLSMSMLTLYLFYRYTETNSAKHLFLTALAFSATVWTKQTAFYLAFFFLLYLIQQGQLVTRLKEKKTWGAVVLILVALVPLALITLWLGDQNLAQSIGKGLEGKSPWLVRWERLPEHFTNIVHYQTTLPFLLLMLFGMTSAAVKREKKAVFFALFILVTFLFFSYVIHKNERYTIYWLPAFALFAALPLYFFRRKPLWRNLFAAILVGVAAWDTYQVYAKTPNHATGYDTAAAFVLKNSHSPTVMVDAYNNGYFIYFMRALDPKRSMYVLRADKLLTSSSISYHNRLSVHIKNREGIRELLDRYGIELIVVESRDRSGIKIHQEFRRYLEEGPFDELTRIPVKSNRPPLMDQELVVYRYRDYKPAKGGILELHLPVVGQTIRVPLRPEPER